MENSLTTFIAEAIKQNQSNIYTAIPARVINFNGHTVTCEVLINRVDTSGNEIELPPLADVPVQFPHAGGFCMTVPIKAGDEGLVVFSSRCIDGWYATSEKSKPLDNRINDLSDGIFIVGVNSQPKKIPDFYHDGASIQTDDGSTHIRLTNGTIYIKGNIEHEGNSSQVGNVELVGNSNQVGAWNQSGGDATAAGTVSAGKVVGGGIDLQTHTHTGNGAGNKTTPPN